jgi:ribosomal protein S27E
MPEGYCVKCKAKKEIAEAVEEVMKNGRKAIKGRCPTCGVVMFKILGGKAVVPPPTPAAPEPAAPPPNPAPAPASESIPNHPTP